MPRDTILWRRDTASGRSGRAVHICDKRDTDMSPAIVTPPSHNAVLLSIDPVSLEGDLALPPGARGIVLFAHGSGSSRKSPRNRFVAQRLWDAGLATLLFDLLTEEEEAVDRRTARLRFDIELLTERLVGATDWILQQAEVADLPLGYFGASTGGGAALAAAAHRPTHVAAVVSRGGRPDLAGDALPAVRAPTLLIVGGDDGSVVTLNERALPRLGASVKELSIVPGAAHLFEEPGKLEEVARLAANWFGRHLTLAATSSAGQKGERV
jgi:putative phosphoribosyl transferase